MAKFTIGDPRRVAGHFPNAPMAPASLLVGHGFKTIAMFADADARLAAGYTVLSYKGGCERTRWLDEEVQALSHAFKGHDEPHRQLSKHPRSGISTGCMPQIITYTLLCTPSQMSDDQGTCNKTTQAKQCCIAALVLLHAPEDRPVLSLPAGLCLLLNMCLGFRIIPNSLCLLLSSIGAGDRDHYAHQRRHLPCRDDWRGWRQGARVQRGDRAARMNLPHWGLPAPRLTLRTQRGLPVHDALKEAMVRHFGPCAALRATLAARCARQPAVHSRV